MALNILGQLPYLFCCVLNYGACGDTQMSQNVYVGEKNIVCSCIQNDGGRYVGEMETISSGYASLCVREGAMPVERVGSYLMRIADDGGLRNPFGQTQKDLPIPSTDSAATEVEGAGIPSPQLVAVPDEPPLTRWPVETYLVKGILVADHTAVAIVVPPEEIIESPPDESLEDDGGFPGDQASVQVVAEQFVVKIGERLGSNGGKISSIGIKGLTILEGKNKIIVPLNR